MIDTCISIFHHFEPSVTARHLNVPLYTQQKKTSFRQHVDNKTHSAWLHVTHCQNVSHWQLVCSLTSLMRSSDRRMLIITCRCWGKSPVEWNHRYNPNKTMKTLLFTLTPVASQTHIGNPLKKNKHNSKQIDLKVMSWKLGVRFIRASVPSRTPVEWYESVFKCWVGRQLCFWLTFL